MIRALFFGTPAFAVPSLEALVEVADVVGVVCQPDRPVGRGLTLTPPPVKARATLLGLPVVQPTKLRTGEFGSWVRAQKVDIALVIAYGRILPSDVLAGPRLGCLNVHASLLPKYRGAAPITWAVVRGERETGITLMQMDEGMDTGRMLERFPTPIGEDETAGELSERLSLMGAESVRRGLPRFVQGDYLPEAQDEREVTFAPLLRKDDGRIDWALSARSVHDHVRGMSPWPGAFTHHHGKVVKVHLTRMTAHDDAHDAPPGTVVFADKGHIVVACGQGCVELVTVQLEGKKAVRATDWFLGRGIAEGDQLE